MAQLSDTFIDPHRARFGEWSHFENGIELKVARLANEDYETYLEKIKEPYLKGFRDGTIPKEIRDRIVKKAMAHCVLRAWRDQHHETYGDTIDSDEPALTHKEYGRVPSNLKDRLDESGSLFSCYRKLEGNEIEPGDRIWKKRILYTPEQGFALFMDPKSRDFFAHVMAKSVEKAAYRAEATRQAVGKSSTSSNGRATGAKSKRRSKHGTTGGTKSRRSKTDRSSTTTSS